MTFHRPNLEIGCDRAGLWRVEGYFVERIRTHRWQVKSPSGEVHGWRQTLTEACELVWDLICRS